MLKALVNFETTQSEAAKKNKTCETPVLGSKFWVAKMLVGEEIYGQNMGSDSSKLLLCLQLG